MTPEGIIRLKDHEGLRLKPYTDTVGKLTIGWGRNLTDVGISHDEALAMLDCDIHGAELDAMAAFPWYDSLDPVRKDVIVNLVFNMGVDGVKQFHLMLEAIERRDWQAAAYELFNSQWRHQVGKDRCQDLINALERGSW